MVVIDGHKLEDVYGVDLEALKKKATRSRPDGVGGTIYTIPLRDIAKAITGGE